MIIKYDKKFLKDLAKLPKIERQSIESFVFDSLEELSSVNEIHNVVKLSGHDCAYRIRFGNYRLGFMLISANEIQLERVMHRGKFYKNFP